MITHSGTALIDPNKVLSQVGLDKGMRVADLGCGRVGHFVFPAARLVGDTGVVYAVDILEEVLQNIASNVRSYGFDNIQTVWANIEDVGQVPIPSGSIDVCLMINVMSQVASQNAALTEAVRILTNGGKLVIIDWQKKLANLGPATESQINFNELELMAQQMGLKLESKCSLSDYHQCLIFKK